MGIVTERNTWVTASSPGAYAIVVAGSIDACWSDHFGDMRIERDPFGDTHLIGQVPDQAALQGIFERLNALGLPILSVTRLGDPVS